MNSVSLQALDDILNENDEWSARNIQSELQSRLKLRVQTSTIRRRVKNLGGHTAKPGQTVTTTRPCILPKFSSGWLPKRYSTMNYGP